SRTPEHDESDCTMDDVLLESRLTARVERHCDITHSRSRSREPRGLHLVRAERAPEVEQVVQAVGEVQDCNAQGTRWRAVHEPHGRQEREDDPRHAEYATIG